MRGDGERCVTPARAAAKAFTSPLAVTSGSEFSRGGDAFVRACVPEGEPNHWPTLVTDSVSVSVASNAPPHSKPCTRVLVVTAET